jgi:hypothetical protein
MLGKLRRTDELAAEGKTGEEIASRDRSARSRHPTDRTASPGRLLGVAARRDNAPSRRPQRRFGRRSAEHRRTASPSSDPGPPPRRVDGCRSSSHAWIRPSDGSRRWPQPSRRRTDGPDHSSLLAREPVDPAATATRNTLLGNESTCHRSSLRRSSVDARRCRSRGRPLPHRVARNPTIHITAKRTPVSVRNGWSGPASLRRTLPIPKANTNRRCSRRSVHPTGDPASRAVAPSSTGARTPWTA